MCLVPLTRHPQSNRAVSHPIRGTRQVQSKRCKQVPVRLLSAADAKKDAGEMRTCCVRDETSRVRVTLFGLGFGIGARCNSIWWRSIEVGQVPTNTGWRCRAWEIYLRCDLDAMAGSLIVEVTPFSETCLGTLM